MSELTDFPYIAAETQTGRSLMVIYVAPFTDGPTPGRHSVVNPDGHVEFFDTDTDGFPFIRSFNVASLATVAGKLFLNAGENDWIIGADTVAVINGWVADEHAFAVEQSRAL